MITIRLLIFILSFIFCLCGEDYYTLMGLSRNANDEEIKKAFKKLSLKFHPDKNLGKEKEAQEKFANVANAYEILKDAKLRRIYDTKGEKGLTDHQQQQNHQNNHQQHNWNDIFGQFGRGQQSQKLFQNSEVYEIQLESLSKFLRRQEVWVVYFYKNNEESKSYKNLMIELAQKFYGIFKVGSVNCQDDEELCSDEFQVYDAPSVYIFQANIGAESKKHIGTMDVQELAKSAVKVMESFVSLVTKSNYENFVQQDKTKNILLLFTNKKSTPPLFMTLSKDLKGKLIFGQIRDSDQDLIHKFGITKFPTLMILTDPQNYRGILYDSSDYKKDQIMKFLREYAYQPLKSRKSVNEVVELTKQQLRNGNCSPPDISMCVLLITNNKIDIDEYTILKNLADFYREDPFKFYHVEKKYHIINIILKSNLIYSNIFEDINEFPQLVIIKPKRERYAVFQNDLFRDQSLKSFFDEVIGGSIQFKPMIANLELNFINTDL